MRTTHVLSNALMIMTPLRTKESASNATTPAGNALDHMTTNVRPATEIGSSLTSNQYAQIRNVAPMHSES